MIAGKKRELFLDTKKISGQSSIFDVLPETGSSELVSPTIVSDSSRETSSVFPVAQTKTKNKTEKVIWELFVDGASRGNPGPAGAGVYIRKNNKEFLKAGCFLGKKTNNEAEYLALLLGIFFLQSQLTLSASNTSASNTGESVRIVSDSELLIKQINGIYRVRKPELQKLHGAAKQESSKFVCTFEHVLREKNTDADAAANQGVDTRKSPPLIFLDMLQKYEIFI